MKPRLNAGMFLYTQQNQENSNFTEIAKLFSSHETIMILLPFTRRNETKKSSHGRCSCDDSKAWKLHRNNLLCVWSRGVRTTEQQPVVYKLISLWQKRFDAFAEKITDVSEKEKKKLLLVMCVNGCSWHTWTQERWEPNKTFHFLKKKRGKRGVATTFHHLGIRRTHMRVGRWSIEMIKSVIIFCTMDQGL